MYLMYFRPLSLVSLKLFVLKMGFLVFVGTLDIMNRGSHNDDVRTHGLSSQWLIIFNIYEVS